jgi:hypothetical protein
MPGPRRSHTETSLSKAITTIGLTCFLVVGAAAVAILGRESGSAAVAAMAAPSGMPQEVVSNQQSKGDRLTVAAVTSDPGVPARTDSIPREPLRQSFAAITATEEAPKASEPKPKLVAKPVQKPYALLSDAQIAGIKERLKLSPDQESYWPAVENALRAVARKIHMARQADPNGAASVPIDPEAAEVQQLKSAALPLLFQLREDQKREVRTLARLIGLEKVAAAI